MNPDIRITKNLPPRSYPKPENFAALHTAYVAEADSMGDGWMPVLVTLGAVTQGSGVFLRRSPRPSKQTMRDAWDAVLLTWPEATKIQSYPADKTTIQYLPRTETYNVFVGGEWVYSHDRTGPCTDRVALADSTENLPTAPIHRGGVRR